MTIKKVVSSSIEHDSSGRLNMPNHEMTTALYGNDLHTAQRQARRDNIVGNSSGGALVVGFSNCKNNTVYKKMPKDTKIADWSFECRLNTISGFSEGDIYLGTTTYCNKKLKAYCNGCGAYDYSSGSGEIKFDNDYDFDDAMIIDIRPPRYQGLGGYFYTIAKLTFWPWGQ